MPQEIEKISLENWLERRRALPSLREKKGSSDEALREARTLEARNHEEAVDLMWERYLIGKHIMMEVKEDSQLGRTDKMRRLAKGFLVMREAVADSSKYITRYHVESKRPRLHRFKGDLALIEGRVYPGFYAIASRHFEKGIELFQKMEDPAERVNALELSGMLAEAEILRGRVKIGMDVASQTFSAYFNTPDGVALRERDYYTWAVWASGCAIKTARALEQKGMSLVGADRERLVGMVLESDKIINPSPDIHEWGDFSLRRDEITSIKKSLKLN